MGRLGGRGGGGGRRGGRREGRRGGGEEGRVVLRGGWRCERREREEWGGGNSVGVERRKGK